MQGAFLLSYRPCVCGCWRQDRQVNGDVWGLLCVAVDLCEWIRTTDRSDYSRLLYRAELRRVWLRRTFG